MAPWRAVLLSLLVPLGGFAIYALMRYGRHRCIHNDPLCRRDRPCLACYREIYEKADGDANVRARGASNLR